MSIYTFLPSLFIQKLINENYTSQTVCPEKHTHGGKPKLHTLAHALAHTLPDGLRIWFPDTSPGGT